MPRGQSRSSKRRVVAAERRAEAFELRKAGLSYQRIGQALGVSMQAAQQLVTGVMDELAEVIDADAKAVRKLELSRLDQMFEALWPRALRGDDSAVDRALRLMDRRARLLGLDQPARHQVEQTVHEPIILPCNHRDGCNCALSDPD